jgi:hypothetical protein
VVAQRGGGDFALSAAVYCARINGRTPERCDRRPADLNEVVGVAYLVTFRVDGFVLSVDP